MEPTEKGLDFQAFLRGIVRRHKLLMLVIFLGLAIPMLAAVYMTSQTYYVSTATIALEPSVLDQTPLFRDVARRENVLATYLVLLRSRSFSEGVVEALPRESFEELLTHPRYFDAILTAKHLVNRWIGKPSTPLSPQQRAAEELRNARMEFVVPKEIPGISSREAPGVIQIMGGASTPRVAMDLVNTHIQILLNRARTGSQEESRRAREFLEQNVQQVKENLTQAEAALTRFQQQRGRLGLGSQAELDLMKLSQTENAIADAEANRTVLSARIAALRRSLEQPRSWEPKPSEPQRGETKDTAPPPAAAEMSLRFNAFKTAQEQVAKLEGRLAALRERYTEAHPLVRNTQEEVLAAQAKLAQLARDLPVEPMSPATSREGRPAPPVPIQAVDRADAFRQLTVLETEDAALRAKIETLKGQADYLRRSLRGLSQEEVEFSTLRRTVDTTRNLYTILTDRLMAARIREQGEPGLIRVIDAASLPLQPNRSKTQQHILMVLGIAAAFAFGVAFGIEFLRLPVETEADVQKSTGLRVLGSIGSIGETRYQKKSQPRSRGTGTPLYLPGSSASKSIHVELFRAMRAAIEVDRMKHHFYSILFTSAGPGEGKSSMVLNLSHVFQEFGRRILVIDADLRRPSLHTALAVNNRPGLVDYLKGRAEFEEVSRITPSGVVVIPGQVAPGDSSSLLASPRFKELLDKAQGLFDLVFVDSAPILAVPDNLLLLSSIDRTVLVVRACTTSQRDLRKAQREIEDSAGQILGVILNMVNPRDVHYYHRKYTKYYTSRDKEERDLSASSPVAGRR